MCVGVEAVGAERLRMLERLIPRMFHRRLLLLIALIIPAIAALFLQTARLTIAQGEVRRAAAESKLVSRQWTPTVRGKILDAKGRILAQDRPAFAVTLDYSVLTGTWPEAAARRFAKAASSKQWAELSPAQRESLVQSLIPAYREHQERAWGLLARTARLERGTLDKRVADTVADVERMFNAIYQRRREAELRKASDRGDLVTPEMLASIESRASAPIREQQTPRPVLTGFDDSVGFELQLLSEQITEINPWPVGMRGVDLTNTDPIATIPGMQITDVGDREYPFDAVQIEIDRSGMPSPLRNQASDSKLATLLNIDPATNHQKIDVEGVAIHLLGWMRGDVRLEDTQRREDLLRMDESFRARVVGDDGADRGAYREGDRVGSSGVEASMEPSLRGLRGLRQRQLDTNQVLVVPPIAGDDTQLTIDIMLQARVEALMDPRAGLAVVQDWHQLPRVDAEGKPVPGVPDNGTPLAGAAVVLDVDTGEIKAMVSRPGFTRRALREDPDSVFEDALGMPYLNRAIVKPYPPGSIAKAVVLAGAIARGNYRTGDRIACNGHLLADQPNIYRCWIYKRFNMTHSARMGHDLDGSDALCASCNIFFFTLGRRLGPQAIKDVYSQFGVGQTWDLGIGREYGGSLGAYTQSGVLEPLTMGDAIQMGIGQGPVTWTPLHAADAYATLARAGVRLTPTLIVPTAANRRPRPQPVDLNLDTAGISMIMDGLHRSVTDERDGTGHHLTLDGRKEPIFNVEGVKVWGKTGTATAPGLVVDHDGMGPEKGELVLAGDHSWFVVLVGRDRPRYVISVVTEYAGSGGKVSGPICNEIIRALVEEGAL